MNVIYKDKLQLDHVLKIVWLLIKFVVFERKNEIYIYVFFVFY